MPEVGEHGPIDQQLSRNIIPEPGFFVHPWAAVPAPTALEWGAGRLYVTSADGHVYSFKEAALDSFHWLGAADTKIFADGLTQPLGLAINPDASEVFVADSHANAAGVTVGRIQVFTDADYDAVADGPGAVVVDNLPNGRHNTNDMAINPADGLLYITNGSQTDHGEDTCGSAPAICESPYSGVLFRTPVTSRNLGPADLEVVARRTRNIYDVAFWPGDTTKAFVPMNGSDDPASDDVLYEFDTDDVNSTTSTQSVPVYKTLPNGRVLDNKQVGTQTVTTTSTAPNIEDAGFPLCMYSPHPNPTVPDTSDPQKTLDALDGEAHHHHGESLAPSDNPNYAAVGSHCPADAVTRPVASFGGHMSADGLDFARGGEFSCGPDAASRCTYDNDLYVAEWGDLWGGTGHKSGHKVVRVDMRDDGTIVKDHHGLPSVKDFITGGLPIDLTFRPDGSMYVADMGGFIYKVFRSDRTTGGPADPADEQGHDHGGNVTEHVLLDGGAALGTYFEGQRFVVREYDTDGDGEVDHSTIGYDGPAPDGHTHGGSDTPCAPTAAQQAYADKLLAGSKEALKQYDGWAGFELAKAHNFWPYPVTESKLVHMSNPSRGSVDAANPTTVGLWNPDDANDRGPAPPTNPLEAALFYTEGYYFEDQPHSLNPFRIEAFVYGLVDDVDGDPATVDPGPKVINAMFDFPYLTDASGAVIPPPNPTGCLLKWHNHSGAEGAATSFNTDHPTESGWMSHVYIYGGLDPWNGPTEPGQAHEWFGPWRQVPATCADAGCVP